MKFSKSILEFVLLGSWSLASSAQAVRELRALDTAPLRTPPATFAVSGSAQEALLPTTGGVLAHVAVGGPWRTLILLTNPDAAVTANASLSFYASDGSPLRVTLSDGQKAVDASSFTITLPPRNSMFLETVNLPAETRGATQI